MNLHLRVVLVVLVLDALVGCSSASSPSLGTDDDAGNSVDSAIDTGTPTSDAGDSTGDAVTSDAAPITAPADTWTWIDFPDSKCASGTTTGIGVNLHPGSKKLLVYLEGGGSCTDGQTCWVTPNPQGYTSGYGAAEFAKESAVKNRPMMGRDASSGSPFIDANLVFVPYCTGDYHSGTKMKTLDVPGGSPRDTYFWGGRDLDLFLARLQATVPDADHVWLAGGSAGAVATVLDYHKVQSAFGVRTDVIDDSGPPLGIVTDGTTLALWGTQLASSCSSCRTLEEVMLDIRATHPESRFAYIGFQYDVVVANGYGLAIADYPTALEKLLTDMKGDANFQSFVVQNAKSKPQHVVENHFDDATMTKAVEAWLTTMVSDGAWSSVKY